MISTLKVYDFNGKMYLIIKKKKTKKVGIEYKHLYMAGLLLSDQF